MQKDPEQLSDQELAERIQDAIAVLQLSNNEDCAQDVAELVDRYNRVCDTKFVNTIERNPRNYCDDCGEKIQLGDPIKVAVSSIDLFKKQINFLRF